MQKQKTDNGQFTLRLSAPEPISPKVVTPDATGINVSPDGLAATVILGGAYATELTEGPGPDTAVTVSTFYFPVTPGDPTAERFRGYAATVRGFVNKGAGARVTVALEIGGAARTLEFPYGKAVNGDFAEGLFSFEGFTFPDPGGEGTHPGVPLPFAAHVTVVLVVTVQRRPAEAAMIKLDSLDVELVDPEVRAGAGTPGKAAARG